MNVYSEKGKSGVTLPVRTLVLFLVLTFVLGFVAGRTVTTVHPSTQEKLHSSPYHGSVVNINNIADSDTVHKDQQGRAIHKRQLIPPFKIPNLSGFSVATLAPGQTVAEHEHGSMHEVFYVLSGRALFTINGERHSAPSGTMVHLVPREKHHILAQDGDDLVMAYFGITID